MAEATTDVIEQRGLTLPKADLPLPEWRQRRDSAPILPVHNKTSSRGNQNRPASDERRHSQGQQFYQQQPAYYERRHSYGHQHYRRQQQQYNSGSYHPREAILNEDSVLGQQGGIPNHDATDDSKNSWVMADASATVVKQPEPPPSKADAPVPEWRQRRDSAPVAPGLTFGSSNKNASGGHKPMQQHERADRRYSHGQQFYRTQKQYTNNAAPPFRPTAASFSEPKSHAKRFSESQKKVVKPHLSEGQSSFDCTDYNYTEEDYYYDDEELEEPFSSSEEEEESSRRLRRPGLSLPLPRRRIRTLSGTVPPVGYAPVWGGPTMCLSCYEFFDIPRQTGEYVLHLMDKHRIVIGDIGLIVDLKRYIEHWRHRFGQEAIEKIFPEIKPKEGEPLFGKIDAYYLMSEQIPEDMQIRKRLALRRLEEVLQDQQREREDRMFNRQCLFCRYRVKGNRAKLIHHLYTIHHLNLGSPDNLVFVNEYLDLLKRKIDSFQCLYCEKIFPDHNALMEHMRKKQHREVNPKNAYYDKFYVINYLELGKRWLDVLAEDFEDSMPTFVDSEDEEEETAWNEWVEDNTEENELYVMCLFCDQSFDVTDANELLGHMKVEHKFDLFQVVKDQKFDFYQQVKLINYIRKQSYNRICFVCGKTDLGSWEALRKHLGEGEHMTHLPEEEKWSSEEFLVPTYENDYLLCMLEDPDWPVESGEKNSLTDGEPIKTEGELTVENPVEKGGGDADGDTKPKNGNPGEGKRPTPVVIPEELAEVGEYLKDPAVRDELM